VIKKKGNERKKTGFYTRARSASGLRGKEAAEVIQARFYVFWFSVMEVVGDFLEHMEHFSDFSNS